MPNWIDDFVPGRPGKNSVLLPPREFTIGQLHIVDLTRTIDPNRESQRCHLWRFNTGGSIPDFHTMMDLTSHLGTHCECPYHYHGEWPSVGELPLSQFMGRGLYVFFDDLPENARITEEALERHLGDKVMPGDTVILDSPYKLSPFTPATSGPDNYRLHIGAESARWLAQRAIQCVGFGDGVTIEDCEENVKSFYDVLMANNCTFLKALKNLELLKTDTFFISYAPMPIIGLDSCPVRCYAIEGLNDFK